MPVTLKLQFANIEEAQAFLAGKVNAAPAAAPVQTPAPTPPAEGTQAPAADKTGGAAAGAAGTGRKPGKPKKETTTGDQATPTHEATIDVLTKVSEKFGKDGFAKVADILAPFGVQKVKDIKPEQRAEVIKAAEAVLA